MCFGLAASVQLSVQHPVAWRVVEGWTCCNVPEMNLPSDLQVEVTEFCKSVLNSSLSASCWGEIKIYRSQKFLTS